MMMITGAAIDHNFGLASTPDGIGPYGVAAVIIGCLGIGFETKLRRNRHAA